MNTTSNEQYCVISKKTYKHKSGLERYIKNIHEKETSVKHKLRNSRSMETPSLKKHPKVDHTDTGDFSCDSCMKTYKYKSNLNRYIELVHEREQEFDCKRCNLTLKEMSKFREHISTKHNELKTKLKEYPWSILSIIERRIDNKKSFKYLDTQLANDQPNAGGTEIKHMKIQASVALNEIKELFKYYRINLQTRVHFLNRLMESRRTYDCQTWPMTNAQANTLNASYVRCLTELLRNGTSRKPNAYNMLLKNKEVHEWTLMKTGRF